MVGRLVHKADFERMLGVPSRARSAHFAVHHLFSRPERRLRPSAGSGPADLSTGHEPNSPQPVDDLPDAIWVGCIVPKRHARRAVTRNLLRRQIRGAFERHAGRLPAGLWVVRLRSPFAPAQFPSAASKALVAAARAELDGLLVRSAG